MMNATERKDVVAERVREIRGKMPREEFAAQLGYAKLSSGAQQIWRWETAKTLPNRDGAYRLAQFTGKSVAFFLGEDDPEEEAPADLLSALGEFIQIHLETRRSARETVA